jgi:Family of unknown function (DUF6011)
MASIKCGHCGGTHESVQDVRKCYGGQTVATVARPADGATAKQLGFLRKLREERGLVTDGLEKLSKAEASDEISRHLSPKGKAAKAVYEANGKRQAERTAPYPDVPAGHYAVESLTGNNDLDFFRVDRPTEGHYRGRTFVKRVIGGRPDVAVRGPQARAALEAILAAGTDKATLRYGQEIGRCGKCNRHLTDEVSRSRGIGPDCWAAGYGH